MFQWLRRIFRSKLKYKLDTQQWEIKRLEEKWRDLSDELISLKKLATLKPYVLIQSPHSYSFFSDPQVSKDQYMDKERNKCRDEGYAFCHKYTNGNEIWAKY